MQTGDDLILQCGELLQNVAQLVPLSGAVVTMDLYQAAEGLQGRANTASAQTANSSVLA